MHVDRTFSALRSFTQGFGTLAHSGALSAFLVPAVAKPSRLSSRRPRQQPYKPRRCAATLANIPTLRGESTPNNVGRSEDATDKDSLALSPLRRDATAWTALLDPYLPLELRSKNWLEDLSASRGILSIETLPSLLLNARKTLPLKLDLLSYAGIYQGRWTAVLWLVKSMLAHGNSGVARLGQDSIHNRSWFSPDPLDDITARPIWIDQDLSSLRTSKLSLDEITDTTEVKQHGESTRRNAMAQIWQSTASMILAAADRTPDESRQIMSHVYQILAHLHHHDTIPKSIYNYKPAQDPSVLQRPPTLYLLSSRILTTLSDAVWRAEEKEVISEAVSVGARYVYKGHELPGARYKPRVRELGVEVWLELVLWSCVEGGWIKEAACIVAEMAKRKGDHRWSVINWHAIQEPSSYDPPKAAKVDWGRVNTRLGGVSGGIEGYSADPPSVDMGPRTISSEVVAALVDGLVDTVTNTTDTEALSLSMAQHYINVCKSLLEREKFGLECSSWNSIMLRMVESGAFDPESTPIALERILDLAPTYRKEVEASNSPSAPGSAAQEYVADQSAASLGLLHRTLYAHACLGNIHGALRTFRRLQSLVDHNRLKSMQEFVKKVESRTWIGDDDSDLLGNSESNDIPGFDPQIPISTLAAFLDIITETKLYDLGRWLLYADDIDGPAIPPVLYGSRNLQPALFRFATATSDADLLVRVTGSLVSPVDNNTLRALLHCQVALEKWDAVDDLLAYLTDERKANLTTYDIMIVARTVLRVERQSQNDGGTNAEGSLSRARNILEGMLRGAYDVAQAPSQPRNFLRSRLLNQLSGVLATVPGILAAIVSDHVRPTGRSHAIISISTKAFNILLDGVVEVHGAMAGKALWDKWCQRPCSAIAHPPLQHVTADSGISEASQDELRKGRVVTPTLQTLRIILRSAVLTRQETFKQSSQAGESKASSLVNEATDGSLLDWGATKYREFGLSDGEINQEIPVYIPKQKRTAG